MGPQVNPDLSVCILSWNTRELLRDCLASIFADGQSGAWQVVVVDNASTDGSAAMVEKCFPRAEVVVTEQNLGFSRGNNLGLARAQGRYWLLLNSDTRVETGALGGLVEFMDGSPEAGVVGPKLLNGDGSLQLSCGVGPNLKTEIANKFLLHKFFPFFKLGRWDHSEIRVVDWVSGACLLVRREAAEAVGLLDPEIYMFHEDLEWCTRMRKGGWKTVYFPFSRVYHIGGQSTRKNFAEMLVVSQRSQFYFFHKHFSRAHLWGLRLLTVVETVLRSAIWSVVFLLFATQRQESRQRLQAYRTILYKTLRQRSYWAPAKA